MKFQAQVMLGNKTKKAKHSLHKLIFAKLVSFILLLEMIIRFQFRQILYQLGTVFSNSAY